MKSRIVTTLSCNLLVDVWVVAMEGLFVDRERKMLEVPCYAPHPLAVKRIMIPGAPDLPFILVQWIIFGILVSE